MSELMVASLPLSDQIALELKLADKTMANVRALFAAFELPVEKVHPLCPAPVRPTGRSIPFPTAEHTAMEMQCNDHPPLQVCGPGHRPLMFKKTADLRTLYYVSCGACAVRTSRFQTTAAAADAWAKRDVVSNKAVA